MQQASELWLTVDLIGNTANVMDGTTGNTEKSMSMCESNPPKQRQTRHTECVVIFRPNQACFLFCRSNTDKHTRTIARKHSHGHILECMCHFSSITRTPSFVCILNLFYHGNASTRKEKVGGEIQAFAFRRTLDELSSQPV